MLHSLQYLNLQPNGYSLTLWGVAVITTALALFCWSRRPALGASLVAGLMVAVTIWAAAYGLELASLDLETMLFWVRIEYLGIPAVPILWLLFALQYSGHDRWLARPGVLLFFVVPLCTLMLNYTNPWHHLYYAGVGIDRSGPFPVLALQKGIWYWVNATYGYLCLLLGSTLLLRHVLYSPNLYRRQAWALVIAALAPVVGNVLYQLGVTPITYLDLTPFVFLVTGVATAWSLYWFRLFDVTPVARGVLIQSLREGIVVLDAQGRIVDLNPAAQEYLGLDEATVGRPVQTVESHWPGLAEFCSTNRPARTEIMFDLGRPRYLEMQLSPLADPDGGFAGSVLVVRNTTEQKEAEAAEQARQVAEASYQMIRQVVETVGEGLVLLDQDHRVVMANRLGEAHLHLLASINGDGCVTALGGVPFEELMDPPEVLPHHVLTLAQPDPYHFEVSIHPLSQMELLGGWLIVTRDVTQIRQIQQHMEQQGRLAAVGQLAAGIAHDFNNILAVIMLYTTLLQRSTNLLPKQQEQLEVLRRQADQAGHLIQQILDFSRRAVIERVVVDLASFLAEMVELWRHTLPETITVALQVEPGQYYILADRGRLQQSLLNLAVNARDAMPAGGQLWVHLARRQMETERPVQGTAPADPREWIAVQIRDTGMGIEPAVLPHVFEPFFTTKEPGRGAGLGLAQVFGIVKQHGGEIQVESQVGQGTTVTLYFPPVEAAPAAPSRAGYSMPQGGRETILVVEDEEPLRQAVEELLGALGYRVLAAGDGEEARAMIRKAEEQIDLVVSDLVMPRLGGVGLYQALQEERPSLKLILTTAYPLDSLDSEGRQVLGQVPWLQKPYSVEALAQKIRTVLDAPRDAVPAGS